MNFTMTSPCENCPFRTDVRPYIRAGRAREIADGLVRRDATFQCHKTVDYSTTDDADEDGNPGEPNTHTKNAQHCAGAMIMLEHMDRPNQMMRIGERVGFYDRRKLKMDSPVYRSDREFIAAHVERERTGSSCRTRVTKSATTARPAKKSTALGTRTRRTTSAASASHRGPTRTRKGRPRS